MCQRDRFNSLIFRANVVTRKGSIHPSITTARRHTPEQCKYIVVGIKGCQSKVTYTDLVIHRISSSPDCRCLAVGDIVCLLQAFKSPAVVHILYYKPWIHEIVQKRECAELIYSLDSFSLVENWAWELLFNAFVWSCSRAAGRSSMICVGRGDGYYHRAG